jgi:Tfp pilus assembly protein FimT
MLITIVAARNEALRSHTDVSVCPSADPSSATATCADSATAGYIAFIDVNGDCVRDAGDQLAANFEIHDQVNSDRNATCISFASTGFRRVIAGQPTTARAVFCDSRGNTLVPGSTDISFARGVEILPTGRAYVSRGYAELGGWDSGADAVGCP